ncbi:MAG: tyrosine-type recombinase/integrase [Flavobacterium sp. JAD_PAG50586_2]|nr:MAG: tyrosine-type recombinase/integrase [Flavobacterium sp. JAD_PAG50586_2]
MATINFRIRGNSNKPTSIKIIFVIGSKNQLELKTGFSILPNDWSDEKKRPKQTKAENKNLSANLDKLKAFVFDKFNEDNANGILIDKYWLQNKINDCFGRVEKNDNGLLINHLQHIIDNANTRKIKGRAKLGISENRIKNLKTFKALLETYQSQIKKQIHFLDINKVFIDRLVNWLINTKRYSINYSGKVIDNLKTICLDADKNAIPINEYSKHIEGFSEANEDRYIVTLDFDELDKIQNVDLKNGAHENARKWILIGCEIGQRGNDLLSITKDNIRYKSGNMYIDLIQQKTGKSITIGIINQHIIDIIENDFPHKISTQKFNDYIKEVCKLAGITNLIEGKKMNPDTKRKELGKYQKCDLVTSHSFRRSFATNYYKKYQPLF